MDPKETAKNYDAIASWWLEQMTGSSYGVQALERMLTFVENGRHALDVGCGCEGRFIRILLERGFDCTGLDISKEMVSIATQRYPHAEFVVGDICTWQLPQVYDLIIAWDSTFHLPLESHEPVLLKLCNGLSMNGVLLFTCGEERGERVQGQFGGKQFQYSTLGVRAFVNVLWQGGCTLQHVEYDQYPANHVYVIAKKLNMLSDQS